LVTPRRRRRGRSRTEETIANLVFKTVAATSIVTLLLIFVFLFREGIGVFRQTGLIDFIVGPRWAPVSKTQAFGALPLIVGSATVTFGAALIAIPTGIGVALYLAEAAPRTLREMAKAIIELLAGIPSVVYGFVGLMVLAPMIKGALNLPSGLSAFTASIVLGVMALPTVVSISEDALSSVPDSYRQASLALGASRWETALHVVLPAAKSGLLAAAMLGIGRAIGETMAVLMVAGNATVIPGSPFDAVRTITADIAAEMGEVVQGGLHYQALFGLGVILFAISFVINLVTDMLFRGAAVSSGKRS